MSDNVLRIIPRNPEYVPDEKNFTQVLTRIAQLVYDSFTESDFNIKQRASKSREKIRFFSNGNDTLRITIYDSPQFIDNGSNLDSILCPYCESQIDSAGWTNQLHMAADRQFKYLLCTTPCCAQEISLNDLRYEWLVGFARFIIEVDNVRFLNPAELAEIEALLDCKLSQIMAHY